MAPRSNKMWTTGVEELLWESTTTVQTPIKSALSSCPPKHLRKYSVRFSTIQVHHVERYYPDSNDDMELTSDDKVNMHREEVRKKYVQAIFTGKHREEEDFCTQGIEHLSSRESCNELLRKRLAHINAVLDEQERQDDKEIADPLAVAFVSYKYSKWARERAISLGEEHARSRDE